MYSEYTSCGRRCPPYKTSPIKSHLEGGLVRHAATDPSRRQANRGVSRGIPASIPLFLEIRSRDNPLEYVILYSKCGHLHCGREQR